MPVLYLGFLSDAGYPFFHNAYLMATSGWTGGISRSGIYKLAGMYKMLWVYRVGEMYGKHQPATCLPFKRIHSVDLDLYRFSAIL
ncbi:hypothetical protein MKJ04_02255 [Pontibacter sp. E15-1]|uniref:hypothetical protein n=1 Tax=Pontibacter sp. E15-1 TaxID=2919918 RepID=UPI001F4FA9F8|nr:hypothetical protein [Pontibacter sp. E15-1]MCJ8163646.1 hypothetical protein [Pontibacter sp. E15-1]